MVESNYEILGIQEGDFSVRKFVMPLERLVLEFHSDRGGDDEQFKKIKRRPLMTSKIGKKVS